MSWQRNVAWTPLEGDDISELRPDPSYDEFKRKSDASVSPELRWNPGLQIYEMHDMSDRRSHHSSAPLLQPEDPLIQKASRDPSIRESIIRTVIGKRRQFSGWKIGVAFCAAIAGTVCLLNVSLTVWAVTSHKLVDGISYLYTGSCTEVAQMSLWIHLGINLMSTLLLSASNYTMQIISSPTRKEVDAAHREYRWLDIGIPSTRNLFRITRGRVVMWLVLALSSIPLHLMYNTAVFSSLAANAYDYIVVTEQFLTTSAVYSSQNTYGVSTTVLDTLHQKALDGTLIKYDAADCQKEYSVNYVSKVRNVLLVTTYVNSTRNALASSYWSMYDEVPYYWICGDGYDNDPYSMSSAVCTLSIANANANNWVFDKYPISYCMVEPAVEECRLSFSLSIMLGVIAANITKCAMMLLTLWRLSDAPLVTIGDAIESFLDNPDPTTVGICLSTKEDINKKKWKNKAAKRWVLKRHFWFKAASVKRWMTCNILCIGVIGLGCYLFTEGISNTGVYNLKQLYELGFGTVSANSLVGITPPGLILTVLFANLPQGILSFLYLTYNGIFSCVLAADEWSRYAYARKPLRVTAPIGQQRSTYYLQLPYTYAIPLLIISGSLHWLMSQSLFLALITVFDDSGAESPDDSISQVGYSCIAIFFAIIVGSIAVLGGIINGFRRYPAGMPLVGSCSAAISAACHAPKSDEGAALKAVKWGVVDMGIYESEFGHCSFSSWDVVEPTEGQMYAGCDVKFE